MNNSYAFDDFARLIVADAMGEVLKIKDELKTPIKWLSLGMMDLEILPWFAVVETEDGSDYELQLHRHRVSFPRHVDSRAEDTLLPAFWRAHGLTENELSWGNTMRMPHSLFCYEMTFAAHELKGALQAAGVAFSKNPRIMYGDPGSMMLTELSSQLESLREACKTLFQDATVKKAFSELCYGSAEKQSWFLKNL